MMNHQELHRNGAQKVFFVVLAMIFAVTFAKGQPSPAVPSPPNNVCANAAFICQDQTIACLGGSAFACGTTMWFYFQVTNPGVINISATPNGDQFCSGMAWGPFTSPAGACASMSPANRVLNDPLPTLSTTYSIPVAAKGYYFVEVTTSGCVGVNVISLKGAVLGCDPGTEPPPDCKDCIGSFAPDGNKQYMVSAWVKESNAPPGRISYTHPKIFLDFYAPGNILIRTAGPYLAKGIIIDGWQRIEDTVFEPATTADLKIRLVSDTGDCYFDDIRMYPFDGEMKTFVYDPQTLRLVSELDEQNYATIYEYDEEGKLIRVKKETERGVMTIKEVRTHVQKQ